jgi:RNA exonuclease 1
LIDIQYKLASYISSDTLIIGHSLESDLRALNICHSFVCDTAVLYPHYKGLPFKYSLKKLAMDVLGKNIQDNTGNFNLVVI